MNPMPELIPMLKQLRLSGILDSIETRNRQAIEEKLSYMDFLATIIQDEIARRAQKRLASALRRANFRNQKTLEEFDFTFNPNINRSLILDLASGRFIQEKVCVFIVGPCGTGKSHIAQALGQPQGPRARTQPLERVKRIVLPDVHGLLAAYDCLTLLFRHF